ncbi:acetyl-CoA acetyltransferase [Alkalihalophilus pseudofirmus]|nr:acetyl-CoA acetyltransferase [Alkalihalophilus pseudofirmus]
MREAVIVESVRTSMLRKNGYFSKLRPDEIVSVALKEIIKRTSIPAELVDDIIMGCPSKLSEPAVEFVRLALLNSSFPNSVPSTTVERQCGSSQQAIHFAAQAIISGDMDIIIAAGVEASTSPTTKCNKEGFNTNLPREHTLRHQERAAELIADIWGLSRVQLDEYAIESHEKAIRAIKQKRFEREIVPVKVVLPAGEAKIIQKDEGPRNNITSKELKQIKPTLNENTKIHGGNSSFLSDGSAAILIMSNTKAKELGLKPRFRIVNRTVVGSDPNIIFTGLIIATNKALAKVGLRIDDIDVFEISEVYASVPLIWLQETGADPNKLNLNGGAIALGHPLSANGARLLTTLIHELERKGGRYGLLGIGEGYGMANVTIIERLDS